MKTLKQKIMKKEFQKRYSDEDLIFFKEIIEKKLILAKNEFKELTGAEFDDGPKDNGEKSQDNESREINYFLANRQEKFIRDLKNALIRIQQKTYGICRKTGELIPKERLIIVPHATLCAEVKPK